MQIQGQYAPSGSTWYNSSAAEETEQIKAAPGLLFVLAVTNFNAAARFAYVFDTDNGTTTGAPIIPPIPLTAVGTSGSIAVLALPVPVPFSSGLFVAASSTGATYTASAGSDLRMTALFK